MSNYVDHNALLTYAREKQKERVEAGNRSIPGHPHAESSGIAYEIPDFTEDDLVGIGAGAEQLAAARREADQHCFYKRFPEFKRIPDVRKMVAEVKALNRRAWASRVPGVQSHWPHDLGMLGELIERPRIRGGHWLSEFGEGTDYDKIMRLYHPDRSARLLGVFAGKPEDIHVLTSEYNVDAWLAGRSPKHGEVECDWKRYSYKWPTRVSDAIWRNCFDGLAIRNTTPQGKPMEYLVFSDGGSTLIAIATCKNCRDWLMRGGTLAS